MTHATIARGLVTVALVFLVTWMLHEPPATRMTAAEENLVRGGATHQPGLCDEQEDYWACHDDPALYRCNRGDALCQQLGQEGILCAEEITFHNPVRCKSQQHGILGCTDDDEDPPNPGLRVLCTTNNYCYCFKTLISWEDDLVYEYRCEWMPLGRETDVVGCRMTYMFP